MPGGTYSLEIPAGADDKPIVADIPAEAIDEDTGEAVGRKLVFTAPAQKPEFLSPITTLVQQELKSNPSLDVEEAESAVKTVLGIEEESNVSLFEDYVAQADQSTTDEDRADQFKYLHDTARVIASMMKDIESQVESAATEKGVDVAGDLEAQRAIRELVRSEVRELLPDIARNVAEIVSSNAQNVGANNGDEAAVAELDPDRIAQELRPTDATDKIDERIDAIKDRPELQTADMQLLLADGMFWIELDCHHEQWFGPRELDVDGETAKYDDNGPLVNYESQYDSPACEATYGFVQLNDQADQLINTQYVFDNVTGGWVADEEPIDDYPGDFALIDGEWIVARPVGPEGDITFTEDGDAVISNDSGQMVVRAVSQALGGKAVANHLWESHADPVWFELADPTSLFSAESETYRLSVRESVHPHLLFNRPSPVEGEDKCTEYGGNCNVVHINDNGQSYAATSLSDLREAALTGVELKGAQEQGNPDLPAALTLMAQSTDDGELPDNGTVKWMFGHDHGTAATQYVGPDIDVNADEYCTPLEYPESGVYPEGTYPERPFIEGQYTEEQYPEGQYPEGEFVNGQFPEGQYPEGEFVDGQFPEGQYPEGEFVDGQLPEGQYPEGEFVDGQLPEGQYPQGQYVEGQYPEGGATGEQHLHCVDEQIVNATGLSNTDVGIEGELKPLVDEKYLQSVDVNPNPIEDKFVSSDWRLITVDGVTMIEIELPFLFRHDDDEVEQSLLVIEHEGFLRLGARLPDLYIDAISTYNETAFETMRNLAESVLSSQAK